MRADAIDASEMHEIAKTGSEIMVSNEDTKWK